MEGARSQTDTLGTRGIYVKDGVTVKIDNVAVKNYTSHGFALSGSSTLNGRNLNSSGNQGSGFIAVDNSKLNLTDSYSNNNVRNGVALWNNSIANLLSLEITGNGRGINIGDNSKLKLNQTEIRGNNNTVSYKDKYGLVCDGGNSKIEQDSKENNLTQNQGGDFKQLNNGCPGITEAMLEPTVNVTTTPSPVTTTPTTSASKCIVSGCNSEICSDTNQNSTCVYKEEYACYRTAKCEVQQNGQCGWTQTLELISCLSGSQNGTTSQQVQCTKYDLNRDNKVTILGDFTLFLNEFANYPIKAGIRDSIADFNSDRKVDIVDFVMFRNALYQYAVTKSCDVTVLETEFRP